jgi:hypothetical protein
MNLHAKIQVIFKHRYLKTIILVSEFLEFCTINYCSKCEFFQAHWLELLNSIRTNFILKFFDIPTSFYEFWNFK